MVCKGICERHKAVKPLPTVSRYLIGQKRCQMCCQFIIWDGIWCPCCGMRLRERPRSASDRRRLRSQKAFTENLLVLQ
jgi:hypothetical protein